MDVVENRTLAVTVTTPQKSHLLKTVAAQSSHLLGKYYLPDRQANLLGAFVSYSPYFSKTFKFLKTIISLCFLLER